MLPSDPVWHFNGVNCTGFAISPGVAMCEASWAVGVDQTGETVSAYQACEVSCGNGGAARDCMMATEPEPEPEPAPEPEPDFNDTVIQSEDPAAGIGATTGSVNTSSDAGLSNQTDLDVDMDPEHSVNGSAFSDRNDQSGADINPCAE